MDTRMSTPQPPRLGKYQVMPPMDEAQFQELKEDIRIHGVLVPIEFDKDGNVIDGHHRFRAFTELVDEGVDISMFDRIVRDFNSEDDKIAYVLSLNVKRRHLTPEQRQELVLTLRRPPFSYTLQRIADTLGVSVSTAWWDTKLVDEETKAELAALTSQSTNGREYSTTYTPRVYQTGTGTLRDMQMKAVQAIGERWRAAEQPVPPQADAALAPAPTDGLTPTTLPVTSEPPITGRGSGVAYEHTLEGVPTSAPAPVQAAPLAGVSDDVARQRMSAFAWYGGKAMHLNWLLPLLPPCLHFVDVFGGSAAVLLNRDPSPIETYNDLDSELVSFFRTLREQPEELVRLLYLTPYSREERAIAFTTISQQRTADLTPLERARRFFVLARQSRSGARISKGHINSWKYTREGVNRGVGEANSQWESAIDGLATVAARLRSVQIENYPATHVISLYDGPGTLFYCDPPYAHETRSEHEREYAHEMTSDDHRKLAAALHSIKGRAALSGYPSALYDELYADWHRFTMPVTSTAGFATGARTDGERIEVLWTNYPLQ